MKTADAIKHIRKGAGMTQIEFAAALGCYQSAVSKYEAGDILPTMSMARKILKIAKQHKLKMSLSDFFDDEEGSE